MPEPSEPSPAQDEPAPNPPARVWLGDRWAYPRTECRWRDGKYANRPDYAPKTQLLLFGGREEAA